MARLGLDLADFAMSGDADDDNYGLDVLFLVQGNLSYSSPHAEPTHAPSHVAFGLLPPALLAVPRSS
jgi:hypothetical protein